MDPSTNATSQRYDPSNPSRRQTRTPKRSNKSREVTVVMQNNTGIHINNNKGNNDDTDNLIHIKDDDSFGSFPKKIDQYHMRNSNTIQKRARDDDGVNVHVNNDDEGAAGNMNNDKEEGVDIAFRPKHYRSRPRHLDRWPSHWNHQPTSDNIGPGAETGRPQSYGADRQDGNDPSSAHHQDTAAGWVDFPRSQPRHEQYTGYGLDRHQNEHQHDGSQPALQSYEQGHPYSSHGQPWRQYEADQHWSARHLPNSGRAPHRFVPQHQRPPAASFPTSGGSTDRNPELVQGHANNDAIPPAADHTGPQSSFGRERREPFEHGADSFAAAGTKKQAIFGRTHSEDSVWAVQLRQVQSADSAGTIDYDTGFTEDGPNAHNAPTDDGAASVQTSKFVGMEPLSPSNETLGSLGPVSPSQHAATLALGPPSVGRLSPTSFTSSLDLMKLGPVGIDTTRPLQGVHPNTTIRVDHTKEASRPKRQRQENFGQNAATHRDTEGSGNGNVLTTSTAGGSSSSNVNSDDMAAPNTKRIKTDTADVVIEEQGSQRMEADALRTMSSLSFNTEDSSDDDDHDETDDHHANENEAGRKHPGRTKSKGSVHKPPVSVSHRQVPSTKEAELLERTPEEEKLVAMSSKKSPTRTRTRTRTRTTATRTTADRDVTMALNPHGDDADTDTAMEGRHVERESRNQSFDGPDRRDRSPKTLTSRTLGELVGKRNATKRRGATNTKNTKRTISSNENDADGNRRDSPSPTTRYGPYHPCTSFSWGSTTSLPSSTQRRLRRSPRQAAANKRRATTGAIGDIHSNHHLRNHEAGKKAETVLSINTSQSVLQQTSLVSDKASLPPPPDFVAPPNSSILARRKPGSSSPPSDPQSSSSSAAAMASFGKAKSSSSPTSSAVARSRHRVMDITYVHKPPPAQIGVYSWTKAEDTRLIALVRKTRATSLEDWQSIAQNMNKTAHDCHERWIRYLKPGDRVGRWSAQEDATIIEAVTESPSQPFTRWSDLAQQLPGRVGKQIRDRWVNQLDPNINHLPFSRADDLLLWEGHQNLGKKWVEISTKYFDAARSENHIKNRWYSATFKKFIVQEYGAAAYAGRSAGGKKKNGPSQSQQQSGKGASSFTVDEDLALWEAHKTLGNRWAEINKRFFKSRRSGNDLKNRWCSRAFQQFVAGKHGPDAYEAAVQQHK